MFGPALHDRAAPRFLARQATGGLAVHLTGADLVALAPQIDTSPNVILLFKDVLGQVRAVLDFLRFLFEVWSS